MTKADLIKALEPFSDELQIVLRVGYEWRGIDREQYVLRDGEGLLALFAGGRISPPGLPHPTNDKTVEGSL